MDAAEEIQASQELDKMVLPIVLSNSDTENKNVPTGTQKGGERHPGRVPAPHAITREHPCW